MATPTKEDYTLFMDFYSQDSIWNLVEWIIELLPQNDFDNQILFIKEDSKKPPMSRLFY